MRPSCRAFMAIPLFVVALLTCAPRSAAQLTVFDPSNLQQNLLSATRALEPINNQGRQLQNQALMREWCARLRCAARCLAPSSKNHPSRRSSAVL